MARKPKSKVRDVLDEHEHGIRPGAAALGLIAMGLTGMIVWNAFFGVHDGHKAKRSLAEIPQGATTRIEVTPPPKEIRTVTIQYDPRVETVQRDLLDSGHYQGLVDGVMGKQTIAAIRRYQQDNGLSATGSVSRELLDHIKYRKKIIAASEVTGSIAPRQNVEAAPTDGAKVKKAIASPLTSKLLRDEEPQTRKVVAAPKKKIQQSKPADDHVENSKKTLEKKKVVAAKTESASPKKPVVKQAQVATGGITRVRDVQTRLRRMGYPIRVVNGEPDKETRAAILKFQLEHDLPMDGAISGALVSALKVSEAARTAQVQ